jgi:hypothetical protein
MNSPDTRLPVALEAALNQIRSTASEATQQLAKSLELRSAEATMAMERDTLFDASRLLSTQAEAFDTLFFQHLSDAVIQDISATKAAPPSKTQSAIDWESLSLVDDQKVDESLHAGRIGQKIAHACEWELRDLSALVSTLLGTEAGAELRNPLRADAVGGALYQAVTHLTADENMRQVLIQELTAAFTKSMGACYRGIVDDLRNRGIAPARLTAKTGAERPNRPTDAQRSGHGGLDETRHTGSGMGGPYGPSSRPSGFAATSMNGVPSAYSSSTATGPVALGGGVGIDAAPLMDLLRRLNALSTQPGALSPMGFAGAAAHQGSDGRVSASGELDADGLPPLMAANLIRAHSEELKQMTGGGVDHLVIDIVGTLFDQILSDSRLPAPMAHQIARLQLPVLRVALSDPTFFSTRKHPVRRFVNRIASLGSAFEEFSEGPGADFLSRVRALVQEILEGDFDQLRTYTEKLDELERFVSESAIEQVEATQSAVTLLEDKETELRTQQRYMAQLRSALAPTPLPDYLRDFLCQVWSQAIVLSSRSHGPAHELTQSLRRTARDLAMSVQSHSAASHRQRFMSDLPGLMRDLKKGLKFIGMQDSAQRDFLSQLMPSHAQSLKAAALSELDYNLLTKQFEQIFMMALPSASAPLPADPNRTVVLENRFSAEEAAQIGLLSESSVDWSGEVDIDLSDASDLISPPGEFSESAANDEGLDSGSGSLDIRSSDGVDIQLDLDSADAPEASSGVELIENLQIGFAYRMLLKDTWQKVRLNYISPGRTFFVFTHGKGQQQTVSLTSRMLTRMCETQRLRALESSYLIERATARARRQLAAIKRSAARA